MANYNIIHDAALWGDLADVKRHLDRGVDVNETYQDETTPLMVAAYAGNIDIIKFLISRGADVNAKNKYGITALMRAVYKGDLDAAKCLIDKGADVNAMDQDKLTPLTLAVGKGYFDIITHLVGNAADVNARDKEGGTALILAAFHGHLNIVKFLVENGADVNTNNKDGFTSLMVAAQEGKLDVIHFLIECGADLNAEDNLGRTATMLALLKGRINTANILMAKEAGVDDTSGIGNFVSGGAAAHCNARYTKEDAIDEMPDADDPKYARILAYFSQHRFGTEMPVLSLLSTLPPRDRCIILEKIRSTDPSVEVYNKLSMAYLKDGNERKAVDVLSCGKQEGTLDDEMYDLLLRKLQSIKEALQLREQNESSCPQSAQSYADTVNILAAHFSSKSLGQFKEFHDLLMALCKDKSSITAHKATCTHNKTSLIDAARNGQLNVVKSLVENGADINAKDKDGMTLVTCAASADHLDVVEYLRQNIANKWASTKRKHK